MFVSLRDYIYTARWETPISQVSHWEWWWNQHSFFHSFFISGPIFSNLGTWPCKMAFGSKIILEIEGQSLKTERYPHWAGAQIDPLRGHSNIQSDKQFTVHALWHYGLLTHMSTVTCSPKWTSSSEEMDHILERRCLNRPIVLLTEMLQEMNANPDLKYRLSLSARRNYCPW